KTLLERQQTILDNSIFRDDIFESTCQKIHSRNEARVIQDITRLIVPSAESLATFGATHLDTLIESVNEGWNNSIPLTGTVEKGNVGAGDDVGVLRDIDVERVVNEDGDVGNGDPMDNDCRLSYPTMCQNEWV
ncbi:hypothetical protein F5883DRAFT_433376, partial [Diaporthe sp. PMI_573]